MATVTLRKVKFYKLHCPACLCTYECQNSEIVVPEVLPCFELGCDCPCHGNPGVVPRIQIKLFRTVAQMKRDGRRTLALYRAAESRK
jgi:hypothetical protein